MYFSTRFVTILTSHNIGIKFPHLLQKSQSKVKKNIWQMRSNLHIIFQQGLFRNIWYNIVKLFLVSHMFPISWCQWLKKFKFLKYKNSYLLRMWGRNTNWGCILRRKSQRTIPERLALVLSHKQGDRHWESCAWSAVKCKIPKVHLLRTKKYE